MLNDYLGLGAELPGFENLDIANSPLYARLQQLLEQQTWLPTSESVSKTVPEMHNLCWGISEELLERVQKMLAVEVEGRPFLFWLIYFSVYTGVVSRYIQTLDADFYAAIAEHMNRVGSTFENARSELEAQLKLTEDHVTAIKAEILRREAELRRIIRSGAEMLGGETVQEI